MTKAFLTLKKYEPLGANVGDLLLQSEKSSIEIGMDKLVTSGYFKLLTDAEALAIHKKQEGK